MNKFAKSICTRLQNQLPSWLLPQLDDELDRIKQLAPESPSYQGLKTYLEWLSDLPWKDEASELPDPDLLIERIDKIHLGRKKIKERLREFFAVAKLKNSLDGLIFCLVGPPGVGRTNLAGAIAKALDRQFIKIRFPELDTEEALHGRKRDGPYPTPSRLLESISRARTRKTVVLLKDIDQTGTYLPTDPMNALMQIIDSQENKQFKDHYLGFPFDLSHTLFITSALTLENIPDAVLSKMEIFHLNAYTPEEKFRIARANLIPKEVNDAGLKPNQFELPNESLQRVISFYTAEAGVLRLQAHIATLCRFQALQILRGVQPISLDHALITQVLGPPKFFSQMREMSVRPGVVTGLSWTAHGGDILLIEVSAMPGNGKLVITGQIGDIMKESAEIAVSYFRTEAIHYGLDIDTSRFDLHIHVPFGAIQKDGPSAGITILTAIFSWFCQRTVDPAIAMTGEISLRGSVARIGALKEKIIAAHRAGIKKVIFPKTNEEDLVEVTDELKSQLIFETVTSVAEVLELTLNLRLKNILHQPKLFVEIAVEQ